MPKHISDKDLYPIETLLADRPDGCRIGEIEKALEDQGLSFNRRTLQRRLARLEKAERILIVGAGRATRYLPIVFAKKSIETNNDIFLSIDAQEIQNRVSRPLSARKPISYQREFIDSYQPNVTWYLPAAIRNHLMDCVGEAIRQVGRGDAINTGEVLSYLAKDMVPENDREHFLKIAREEIAALHEGNFARYRLRPSEFKDWQKREA